MVTLGPLHPFAVPTCCDDDMIFDTKEQKYLCVSCERWHDEPKKRSFEDLEREQAQKGK